MKKASSILIGWNNLPEASGKEPLFSHSKKYGKNFLIEGLKRTFTGHLRNVK
jgi:hypothetical protein